MTNSDQIKLFSETSITFNYPSPSKDLLKALYQDQTLVVLQESDRLILDQTYYKLHLSGATPLTFTRSIIEKQLHQALAILDSSFQIIVFDAFRSRKTQKALFDSVAQRILTANPELTPSEVHTRTSKYIVHPDDHTGFPVPPHNSGGAIDLALCKNETLLQFGSDFDDPSIRSSTDFFESEFRPEIGFTESEWILIRKNRRILFHTFISLGFTNYQEEWWHYDLGDCMWAQKHQLEPPFQSLEPEVELYERHS